MFSKFRTRGLYSKNSKQIYDVLLRDRTHLTDYEQEFLIPDLKYKLSVINERFADIVSICNTNKQSDTFVNALDTIIANRNTSKHHATQFFEQIAQQAQDEYIDTINTLLSKYNIIPDFLTLGRFMTEVSLICSSLLALNNILFAYKLAAYPTISHLESGQSASLKPAQYIITTEPFQVDIDNIVSVANVTSASIQTWHTHNMKLKNQYVQLYTTHISLKNSTRIFVVQLLTIVLAISLSAFFLFSRDPLSLMKENLQLKRHINQLEINLKTVSEKKATSNVPEK
ncbi:MAG: hypothetical protein ACLQVJ_25490 [Syntrophobacteraceae bacterium]